MTESIEMNVTVNGTQYPVRCELPSTIKASSGPMSIRAALEPAVLQLLDRMVTVLDTRMEHPRVVVVDRDHYLKPSA
jgi:hypothetical protein